MRKILPLFLITSLIFISSSFVITYDATSDQLDGSDYEEPPSSTYQETLKSLINESKDNIKKLNDKIRADSMAKKQEIREDRANEYYDMGLRLADQGKFDQARYYFDKAVSISERSELLENIKKSQERLRKQELALKKEKERQQIEEQNIQKGLQKELDKKYQKAVELYKARKFVESRELFKNIEDLVGDYKSTSNYFVLIDKALAQEAQMLEKQKMLQKQEQLREENLALKKQLEQERAQQEARKKQQEDINKQEEQFRKQQEDLQKQQERSQKIQDIENQKALERQLKEEKADREQKLAFQQQQDAKIQQELERKIKLDEAQNQENITVLKQDNPSAEEIYKKALALFRQKKYAEARDEFLNLEKVADNYRLTHTFLNAIDQQIAEREAFESRLRTEELKRQQRQADFERRKQFEVQKQEEIRKQQQEKKEFLARVEADYSMALSLFKDKQYVQAREKFQSVDRQLTGYKSVNYYLERIDRDEALQKKSEELVKQREQDQQRKQEEAKKLNEEKQKQAEEREKQKALERQQKQEQEAKRRQEIVKKQEELAQKKAAELQRKKDEESKRKEELQKKAEEREKQKALEQQQKREQEVKRRQEEVQRQEVLSKQKQLEQHKAEPQPKPAEVVAATPIQSNLSREEQINEAQLLSELAEKSSKLYQEITTLADDKDTIAAKNKLAKVDGILNNLRKEKEYVLRQIKEEERRRQQEALKEKERVRLGYLQQTYEEALNMLKNKDFQGAKKRFLEIENNQPGYKSTSNYLAHIDEDQRRVEEDAKKERAIEEERKLREQQENQKKERIAQLQERLMSLAQQATNVNDEILNLTKAKNYLAAKDKFKDLESILSDLKVVKEKLAHERGQEALLNSQKDEQRIIKQEAQKILNEKRSQARTIDDSAKVIKERQKQKSIMDKQVQASKDKELRQQKERVFQQAVDLYDSKKYDQAKIIFGELASQGDDRALGYLRKIDRLIEESFVKAKKEDERERKNYLAERLRQQRLSDVLGVKEQQRQRNLTQGLERQRLLLEQQQQEERRRSESLRLEERRHQRIENKRRQAEEQARQKDQVYHFRKVKPVSEEQAQQERAAAQVDPKVNIKHIPENPLTQETPLVKPTPIEPPKEDLQKQKEQEKEKQKQTAQEKKEAERKRIEDLRKQKEEERAKRRQAIEEKKEQEHKRIEDLRKQKEEEKAKQKQALEEQKEKENKHLEELNKQKEQEQEKIRKELEEQREKEDKRFEELRKQKEQERLKEMERRRQEAEEKEKQRLERMKSDKLVEQHEKERIEMAKVVKERQQNLENERKAIRQQLANGVEDMYAQAVKLYKSGHYPAAAQKFSDVADLMPNYKKTDDYLNKLKVKIDQLAQNSLVMKKNLSSTAVDSSKVSTPDRKDQVAKTLDLFDSTSK